MSSISLGDLAQTFMLQRRGAELKADMTRLNQEVATGQVSDIKSVLDGNVTYLTNLESDLKTLAGYRVATTEATQFADSTQTVLERVDSSIGGLGTTFLTLASSAVNPVLDQFSADALTELETIVSALNTTTAGRSLFAGNATDQRALEDAGVILSGLRGAAAGATTPQDIIVAADLWFSDPAGFEAVAYVGSDEALAPIRLGKNEAVRLELTANDPMFRDILKSVAVAVIAADPGFGLSVEDQRILLKESGEGLFKSQGELTAERANVGSTQARIDVVATRNSTEEYELHRARNTLLGVDPYEAATELEAVQFQLQSLYAITARMSEMSFVNYIR